MLIPVCSERLPVRLEIQVLAAKCLPVMNKSINSTDAFVEIHFLDNIEKTDVITSLNPEWNSDTFVFDTDEKELAEEWIQFRVMDHDTYSANDAIGRVCVDGNVFVERMRMTHIDSLSEQISLKIYDTIYGIRGELTVSLKFILLMRADYNNYVHIFSSSVLPANHRVVEIIGLVDNMKCEKDPDYEWLDRIRTPRATNEARQAAIRATLRDSIIGLAQKASKSGANLILGFKEYVDMEGSYSDLLTCRVIGTAVRGVLGPCYVDPYLKPQKPVLTIDSLPDDRQIGLGAFLAARSVQVIGECEEPESIRKGYWITLRSELYHQAKSIGCNVVLSYSERVVVHEGVAMLQCTGTAVAMSDPLEMIPALEGYRTDRQESSRSGLNLKLFVDEVKEKRALFKFQFPLQESREKRSESTPRNFRCSQFHSPLEDKSILPCKFQTCFFCKSASVADYVLSSTPCPQPQYYVGPRTFVQVSVCKKISSDPNEPIEFAAEVGNAMPYVDHELIGLLMTEVKNVHPQANSIFRIQCTTAVCDGVLVCVMTGISLRLLVIPKGEAASPSISNVLSFSNLQWQNDNRRFSWGTVREAIRFKPSVLPTVSLKILNLKQLNGLDDSFNSNKNRLRINTLVDKVRRKQQKEYVSHVVFERHLSLSIGIHEPQVAGNSASIAGVHLTASMYPLYVSKDEQTVAVGRFSDVYVREDLSTAVKDSTSVDGFVTNALEERMSSIRLFASLGGPNACISDVRLQCPQFTVSKEHAHMIILVSFDIIL